MLGLWTKPCDVIRTQILMLYNHEVWKPRGTYLIITWSSLDHHLLWEALSEYVKKLLCNSILSTSCTSKLFNRALLQLSPKRTPSVTFVITYQQATINQLFFPSRVVIGFVNISSYASSMSLKQVSLSNHPAGKHQRTWYRSSHSEHDTQSYERPLASSKATHPHCTS